MKNISKQFVSTCAILMPLVSALLVPQPAEVFSKLPNKARVHARTSSSALNFHNPNMDHLDGYRSSYKARESPISLGNRFRTVPKPYYDSNFQHKPARPLSTPPLGRSSPSSATAAAPSDNSEYGTQNVYWSDVNGFPQDVIDQQAMPSMDDMRAAAMVNNGQMNEGRIYSPDKYYQNDPIPSSSSRFQDIPFQSNENYAKKFYRNAERERQGAGYSMNGDFANRPIDRPYGADMLRPGEMNMGDQGYGMQSDFPSLMNEIMPPPRGHMQSMGDPYSYGQGYGGYDHYGGMSMGGRMEPGMVGGMEPGMAGGGMMGMGMDMPRGEWGFQEMGMGPGGEQWGYQEWGYGAPLGGEFYGGQQEWGMPPGGEPFGGEPFGGPGGFW